MRDQFENVWLSRYPVPNRCIHDNGGEFFGWEFIELLQAYGIKDVVNTVKNPQSNAICERMHQTVAAILRVSLHTDPPANVLMLQYTIDNALARAMYATRVSNNNAIATSPGAMVFNRDMFVDVPLISDLASIRDRRQHLVDDNLRRQNQKRIQHNYAVSDLVLLKTYDPKKLEERCHGPYPIIQVYTNGTVEVLRSHNLIERVNI